MTTGTTTELTSGHPAEGAAAPPEDGPSERLAFGFLRGHPGDPAWARPALLALLVGTGVLYLWALSANGWANEFYSAAAQAGSRSWKAFFFGSSDAANSITVDKPPTSLWPQALSVRMFGLSSWSHARPPGPDGDRHRRRRVRDRPTALHRGRGPPGRGGPGASPRSRR